jgi:hypothetical protein
MTSIPHTLHAPLLAGPAGRGGKACCPEGGEPGERESPPPESGLIRCGIEAGRGAMGGPLSRVVLMSGCMPLLCSSVVFWKHTMCT